ncbi:hypothetical protein ACLUXJ_06950 [Lactobacillus porci]|uniref:hypothetical protein n=1 Tax=Lactobacillus porci TaxID=2012477 RepID=UPI003991CB0D
MHSRKFLSFFISFFMVLSMSTMIPTYAKAETSRDTFKGDDSYLAENNYGTHTYSGNWASPTTSYLEKVSNGYMRVQASNIYNYLVVEYYDSNFNYLKTVHVKKGLPLFGGFYSDGSDYYVVTGQENEKESDDSEVYRITKYDTAWKEEGAASVKGANTFVPFDAGSCSMDKSGSTLAIHTCHTMYTTSDGLNHQANVNIIVNTDTMTVTHSATEISNFSYNGYVSHSFNQYVKIANGKLIEINHGDAYPRAVLMTQFDNVTSSSFTYNNPKATFIFNIKGGVGDNYTGVEVGGFEVGKSHYLVAGTTISQTSSAEGRNVFLSTVDQSDQSVSTKMITNFTTNESSKNLGNPFLVKLNDNSFMLIYENVENDQHVIHYQTFDDAGNSTSQDYTMKGRLSDCAPLAANGKIIWYTYDGSEIGFYAISQTNLSDHKVTRISVPMDKVTISGLNDEYTYTGSEIKPRCTLTYEGQTLEEGKDYRISYSHNIDAGEASITLTGMNSFKGTVTRNFNIEPKSVKNLSISLPKSSYTFTGYYVDPEPIVHDGTKLLDSKRDYRIFYDNDLEPGTATLTIRGRGNYDGDKSINYKIIGKASSTTHASARTSLQKATVSKLLAAYDFTGKAIKPTITLKLNGKTLVKNKDYKVSYQNNSKLGKATVTITGIGQYTGKIKKTFKIVKKTSLKKAKITLPKKTSARTSLRKATVSKLLAAYGFTGKAIKPTITLKLNGKTLVKNKDYKVSYQNNSKLGKATVTITGIGQYTGKIKKTFKIVKKTSLKKAKITLPKKTYKYTKKAIKPNVKVKLGKKTLKKNVDYTISYKNNKKKGKATITIKGKNLYTGTRKTTFKIK